MWRFWCYLTFRGVSLRSVPRKLLTTYNSWEDLNKWTTNDLRRWFCQEPWIQIRPAHCLLTNASRVKEQQVYVVLTSWRRKLFVREQSWVWLRSLLGLVTKTIWVGLFSSLVLTTKTIWVRLRSSLGLTTKTIWVWLWSWLGLTTKTTLICWS